MSLPYARALVTGASGLIGLKLCRELAQKGIEVHATALQPDSLVSLNDTNSALHYGDITQGTFLEFLIAKANPEVIFHLAAYGTFSHEKDAARMVDVNINATRNLLELCKNTACQSFVFAGSVKEYATGRTPITEDQLLQPWDEYAVTKSAASFFCRLQALRHKLTTSTLRLSPIYGPNDSEDRFVISAIRAALDNTPFTLSVGSLVRNFLYRDDAVAAFIKASTRKGNVYEEFNIGGEQSHSFTDILAAIEKVTGKKITIVAHESASTSDDSWVVDIQKAHKVLDWKPTVTLEEGIRQTIDWYHTHRDIIGQI